MSTLFLLFSHTLTPQQREEAVKSLKVSDICSMPKELLDKWSQISPRGEFPIDEMEPFVQWLEAVSEPGDYVLIQGEFGAVFYMVNWCFSHERIPIYATTHRHHTEHRLPDEKVEIIKQFSHVNFRRYPSFIHKKE